MRHQHLMRRVAMFAAAVAVGLPAVAMADVSDTIRLQGRLTTNGGGPAPDGDYGLTVSFYATKAATKPLFTYVDAGVKVQSGVFTVSVGQSSKLDLKSFISGKAGWVGIKVGSDAELPRLAIHKVPYAIAAHSANSLSCTGCVKSAHIDPAILKGVSDQMTALKTGLEKSISDLGKKSAADDAKIAAAATKKVNDLAKKSAAGDASLSAALGKKADKTAVVTDNQSCKAGQVVVGFDTAGKVKCAADKTNAISTLDARYVNVNEANSISGGMVKNSSLTGADIANSSLTGSDIKDKSISAADLAACPAGQVLRSSGTAMACVDVAQTQQAATNFVANPTLHDSNGDKRPDRHSVKSSLSSSYYRFVQLSAGDLAAIGSFSSSKLSSPAIYGVDLRSSVKTVDASIDLGVRVHENTSFGAWVTCSVWVKRPDTVGTNAVAALQCFGKTAKLTIKKGDQKWHRLKVTQRVVKPLIGRRMSFYGSGFATGGDPAYLRYGLPKIEYGPSSTAWTPGANAVPSGMIAFFAQKCPPGWSEYTALRGRVPVGNPSNGSIGYARGGALSNKGARVITQVPRHRHSVDPPSTTSSAAGNHAHSINPPKTNTSTTGKHRHYHNHASQTSTTAGNHRHGINTRQDDWNDSGGSGPSWGDGDNGQYKSWHYTEYAGNHTHKVDLPGQYSDYQGNHNHSVDIGAFNSSTTGNHSHTTNIGAFNSAYSGSSSVEVTMPYLQLVACYAQ